MTNATITLAPLAETLRIFRPAPNIIAFYDGRVPGVRAYAAGPNWLDDGAYALGVCTYAILDGAEPPDVLLLDIRLGDESGLRLLDRWAGRTAIVIFTAYDYPQYVRAALDAGAAGFVAKSDPSSELLAAVRRAALGDLAFTRRPSSMAPALSAREIEVIRLVADGCSNDEIGHRLGVTSKTVEGHIGRLFVRTKVHSRTELAIRAVREGWLDLPGDASATTV